MIKEGQVWVCINQFHVNDIYDRDYIHTFNPGDLITIKSIISKEKYDILNNTYQMNNSYEEFISYAYCVGLGGYRNFKVNEIIKHFIPLAEWRAKQIDKILEDD